MTMLGRGKKKTTEPTPEVDETAEETVDETPEEEPQEEKLFDLEESADEDSADEDSTDEEPGAAESEDEDPEDEVERAAAAAAEKARQKALEKARKKAGKAARKKAAGPPAKLSGSGVAVLAVLTGLAVVLAVAFVMIRGAVGDLNNKDPWGPQNSDSKQAVLAATNAAQDVTTFDYRTLDKDFPNTLNDFTGSLRNQYASLQAQAKPLYQQQQVVAVGTVLKAGVEKYSKHQITVLALANRKNTKGLGSARAQTEDQLQILLTMTKVKGAWKVSKIDLL